MASLIECTCMELIRTTRLLAKVSGVTKVYMAGTFVSNDLVRRILTREIVLSKVFSQGQVLL